MAKSFGILVTEFVNQHPECRSPSFSRLKVNFHILDEMLHNGDLSPTNLGELFFDVLMKDMYCMVPIRGVHLYNQLFLPVFRGNTNVE